ncbi:DUF3857 domain-containing protein [bacterium]|nr:DUF3857 domain-containing protein [candidate division CSSED10-310 bacterium]
MVDRMADHRKRSVLLFIIFFTCSTGLPVDAASTPCVTEWPFLTPGSPEMTGLETSIGLRTEPPILLTPSDVAIQARAAAALTEVDSPYIIVFSTDSTVFDRQGYYHLIQQEAVLILTDQGADEKSTVRLNYDLPYNRTRILDAWVMRPDGTIHQLTPDAIRDVSNADDMDANIYEPIWRTLVLSFPEVEPGAVVYWAYEHAAVAPRTRNAFQWGHTFRTTVPMAGARIELTGPDDVPIHWFVSNNSDHRVSFDHVRKNGRIRYVWSSGPAPMIREEAGMIPVSEIMTSLFVTTETWQEFSAREAALIEPSLIPDHAIRSKVAELIAGRDTPESKLEALFAYVTKRVRYMGVAYGDRPGVNPDPVIRTFANNAGVCKDKAGLLTAMLRLAGFESCYTLNNPGTRIVQDVAVDQFNHAVVAVRLPGDSAWRYLDVTTDLTRSMCPASSGGTQVLRIDRDGADIDTIPIDPPENNTGWFTADTHLHTDGSLASHVHYTGTGAADNFYREEFYYTGSADWPSLISYILTSTFPRAVPGPFSFEPSEPDDLSTPISLSFSYSIPGFAGAAGSYSLVRVPLAVSGFDWFYDTLTKICAPTDRLYPADIGQATTMISRETIHLPPGKFLSAVPESVHIDQPYLAFDRTYHVEDQCLIMTQTCTIKQPRVPPGDYPEFRKAFQEIRRSSLTYVVLETVQ